MAGASQKMIPPARFRDQPPYGIRLVVLDQELRYAFMKPALLAEKPTASNPLPASMTEMPQTGNDEHA